MHWIIIYPIKLNGNDFYNKNASDMTFTIKMHLPMIYTIKMHWK